MNGPLPKRGRGGGRGPEYSEKNSGDTSEIYDTDSNVGSNVSMAFKLGMTVDLCMAHIMLMLMPGDNLDLDARPQWVGKGKRSALTCLYN